jgi:antirestriction protein ArdC
MAKNDSSKERRDVHQEVTDQIVASLETGVMPWKRPWNAGKLVGSESFLPRNAATGRPYQGINLLLLLGKGHDDPRWCTLKEANRQGWRIRQGEKGTVIVHSSPQLYKKTVIERDRETGEEKPAEKTYRYWSTQIYRVFNASQIEGIPALDEVKTPRPQEEIDTRVKEILSRFSQIRLTHLPIQVDRQGKDAFYRQSEDSVTMPAPGRFSDINAYYGVLLHEYGHSTGHPNRLNRETLAKYHASDSWRAKEELVAELSSAFVAAELGIPDDLTRNTAYIGSWLSELKKDKREIFKAASMAQKAVDLLMGREQENSLREDEKRKEAPREPQEESVAAGVPEPGIRVVKEEYQKLSGIAEPVLFRTFEETAPKGKKFDPGTPGVLDGGKKYQAITSMDHFSEIASRLGPREETPNGCLVPHGWRVLRGHYPGELHREFFPEVADLAGVSSLFEDEPEPVSSGLEPGM